MANGIYIPDLTPHLEKIRAENEAKRVLLDSKNMMNPVSPFPEKEMTDAARELRLSKSKEDFWFFDKTYFSLYGFLKGYYPIKFTGYIF